MISDTVGSGLIGIERSKVEPCFSASVLHVIYYLPFNAGHVNVEVGFHQTPNLGRLLLTDVFVHELRSQ